MNIKNFALVLGLAISMVLPTSGTAAEGDGSSGGHGGGGCGDVFGDLVHIKRDPLTGQPIFEQRLIEYPGDVIAEGYCPIPLDANGTEIPFAAFSCDPLFPEAVVEVDYFGRLNAGRTKERNQRMHFNEVISNIKDAGRVRQDASGRLMLGYDCTGPGNMSCASWSSIDSPMENMALYTRLMKYGHLQTDPMEIDLWAHDDPALGSQYHPALEASDWAKFDQNLLQLAPEIPGDYNAEPLDHKDFARAGTFLGAAANKHGKITVDMVQYLNRFLKIAQTTETTQANVDTLPALVRLGGLGSDVVPATAGQISERFVDFANMAYIRSDWHNEILEIIRPKKPGNTDGDWVISGSASLMGWLAFANDPPPNDPVANIDGFVEAATDSLRSIEFIHNYAIPVDLGWGFK